MKRIAVVLLAASIAPAHAALAPRKVADDRRIVYFDYNPDDVPVIYGTWGVVTTITLAPREQVEEEPAVGFRDGWEVTWKGIGNRLRIKPRAPGGDVDTKAWLAAMVSGTNLSFRSTANRDYEIELALGPNRGQASSQRARGVMYQVRFRYPTIAPLSVASTAPPATSAPGAAAPVQDCAYEAAGSSATQPVRVCDDGHQTTITFSQQQTLPLPYEAREPGAIEPILDFTPRGPDTLVIAGVHRKIVLRAGSGEFTCVYKVHPIVHTPTPASGTSDRALRRIVR